MESARATRVAPSPGCGSAGAGALPAGENFGWIVGSVNEQAGVGNQAAHDGHAGTSGPAPRSPSRREFKDPLGWVRCQRSGPSRPEQVAALVPLRMFPPTSGGSLALLESAPWCRTKKRQYLPARTVEAILPGGRWLSPGLVGPQAANCLQKSNPTSEGDVGPASAYLTGHGDRLARDDVDGCPSDVGFGGDSRSRAAEPGRRPVDTQDARAELADDLVAGGANWRQSQERPDHRSRGGRGCRSAARRLAVGRSTAARRSRAMPRRRCPLPQR